MLPIEPQDYISIIAPNYLHPLTKLMEAINEIKTDEPNEVQSSPIENGYSVSIIILAVLLTESVINLIQYVEGKIPPETPLKFVQNSFPDKKLPKRLKELFVLRDLIAHNHVWDAKVYWDENFKMKLVEAQLTEGYGDDKLKDVIDENTRLTCLLGLNVFPTRICRSDAIKVVITVVDFLLTVETKYPNFFRLSNQLVKHKGLVVRFTEVVAEFDA